MDQRGKMTLVCVVVSGILILGIGVLAFPEKTTVRVTVPGSQAGCACAVTPAHGHKFLIFWKEKEKDGEKETQVFKTSRNLFDSVTDAVKEVPPGAAEVRIVTVRID